MILTYGIYIPKISIWWSFLKTNSVLYSEVLTMLDNMYFLNFREENFLQMNQKCCLELDRILIAVILAVNYKLIFSLA